MRRWPRPPASPLSAPLSTRGEAGQRPVRGLLPRPAHGPFDLVAQRLLGRGLVQPADVEPVVAARQQRHVGQQPHLVAVGADAGDHRVVALLLGAAVLAPRDPDAGHEPAQVPLPRAGVRLVEVVEVDDQLALGRGVEAEVAEVGVAAGDGHDPGRRQPGDVGGHDDRGAAQEAVRRGDHPRDPDRHELGHAAAVRLLEQGDRVGPVRRRAPVPQAAPRDVVAQRLAHRVALVARGGAAPQRGERVAVGGGQDLVGPPSAPGRRGRRAATRLDPSWARP